MTTAASLILDDRMFMENLILIDDRNGIVKPFIFNPAQELLYRKQTNRELVVKAGQLGITTYFLGRAFKKVITQPNTTAVVVAHEEFLTQRLLTRVDGMYARLPLPPNLKPQMKHNSAYEKSFPHKDGNSVFYIGTAGAKVFGRGEAINHFHASEVAFWPDANKILIPTMQRVPLEGEMVIESTPNGEGNEKEPNVFYEMAQEALDGESIWHLTALEWWVEPEYIIPYGSEYALRSDRGHLSFTTEEVGIIVKAGWSDEEAQDRIRWRRRKIHEMKSAFWQEMLEDITSCFLTTKEPFYDFDTLDRLTHTSCDPVDIGSDGVRIWFPPDETPDEHPVYSISVDPGQGKYTRSVALVWRHDLEDFSRVRLEASLSGLYDSTAFAPMVKRLGYYYQAAKIIPECNGHGLSFVAQITDYPNLYWRTDVVSNIQTRVVGWKTTGAARVGGSGTKIYALTELQSLLPLIEMYDIDVIREMRQVKYAGDNIVFLGNDDFHDAAMIMAATRNTMGGNVPHGYQGTSGWKW